MKPRSPRAVDPAPMMDRTRYPFTSDEWEQPEQFYKTPRYFVGPAEHACCYDAGIYDGHEPEFHSEGRFLGWYVRLADVCDEETAQRMCDLLNAATP